MVILASPMCNHPGIIFKLASRRPAGQIGKPIWKEVLWCPIWPQPGMAQSDTRLPNLIPWPLSVLSMLSVATPFVLNHGRFVLARQIDSVVRLPDWPCCQIGQIGEGVRLTSFAPARLETSPDWNYAVARLRVLPDCQIGGVARLEIYQPVAELLVDFLYCIVWQGFV